MQGEARFLAAMYAIATQSGGREAGFQRRDMLAQFRRAKHCLGERQAQEQRIDPGFPSQQIAYFRRPLLVEQEVGVGPEQIDVLDAERERGAVVALGGGGIARARGDLREYAQRPLAQSGIGIRLRLDRRAQQRIGFGGLPADRRRVGDARRRHQRRRQQGEVRAATPGVVMPADDLQDDGLRQPSLAVARLGSEHGRQIGEC